jgi:hypothetical protein
MGRGFRGVKKCGGEKLATEGHRENGEIIFNHRLH